MKKIAIYGKGGIGKSTTVSNIAAALAKEGLTVMQLGCDPKADSTSAHLNGARQTTILDIVRSRGESFALEDIIARADDGVLCAECGGPIPGAGCAGRGIVTAFETLKNHRAYETYKPDVLLYDVLGDVVCGGFAMPLRSGCARDVFIVTSGEKMSLYAAANIALAIDNFKGRNYARLSGLIQNSRSVKDETRLVAEMAEELSVPVSGIIPRDGLVQLAEERNTTVVSAFPDSELAQIYRRLAMTMYEAAEEVEM
ncbi:MAG: nitrogenase iron protein NifH [Clostridiales bacterium]|nr:nitrogenase iron protein NifH [Clostridiales bacterium]